MQILDDGKGAFGEALPPILEKSLSCSCSDLFGKGIAAFELNKQSVEYCFAYTGSLVGNGMRLIEASLKVFQVFNVQIAEFSFSHD